MQFLVNALMLGGIYALVASGFSLVYGVMNIMNVAHGALVMLGAYIAWTLSDLVDLSPVLSVPVAAAVLFGLGYLLQRYVLNLLHGTTIFMAFIFTFGLQMTLQNVAVLIWDPIYRTVPSRIDAGPIHVAGAYIPVDRVIVFAVAWASIAALWILLHRTKLGTAIQATALDAESAQLAGVDIARIFAITFGIAAALAGIAGSLLSAVLPVYPFMDVTLIGKAFAVAVLGGLGNVSGALVGGLILGIAEQGISDSAGVQYSQLVAYALLLAVLVIRPRGLFGREHFAEVRV